MAMIFALPDDDNLYTTLLDRDPTYDGSVFVGVNSIGVFFRLSCPARKPKRKNCTFYCSPSECINASFDPCKRCHPMHAMVPNDPAVRDLLTRLDNDPTYRWSEDGINALGCNLSTIRRVFKRTFGTTFLDLARARRLQRWLGSNPVHSQTQHYYVLIGFKPNLAQ